MDKREIEHFINQYNWMYKELKRISNIEHEGAFDYKSDRQYQRMIHLKSVVEAVERLDQHLRNDLEDTIYDCMLDGMSYRAIAKHLNMSIGKLHELKENMLDHITNQYKNVNKLKELN